MTDKAMYLWRGGWLENARGWWHPPSCLAAWPLDEAYAIAKKDEASGLRMTPAECMEYHADVGLSDPRGNPQLERLYQSA